MNPPNLTSTLATSKPATTRRPISPSSTIATFVHMSMSVDLSDFINLRPGVVPTASPNQTTARRYKCICGEPFKTCKQLNKHTSICSKVKSKAQNLKRKLSNSGF